MHVYRLPLDYVLDTWRPGTRDVAEDGSAWSWVLEFRELLGAERAGEMTGPARGSMTSLPLAALVTMDRYPPVTLGYDKRVWDGHHTLCWLSVLERSWVLCDVVAPGEKRPWPASECAPPEAWADPAFFRRHPEARTLAARQPPG